MKAYLRTFYKKMFLSVGFWVSIALLIVLLPIFPGSYEFPYEKYSYFSVGSVIATFFAVMMIQGWGYTFSNLKKSALEKRFRVSVLTKKQIIIYTMIPAFTLFFIGTIFSFGYFAFLQYFGIILEDLAWSSIDWIYVVIGYIFVFMISFAIAFLMGVLVKNINLYTSLSWVYILLIFLFGGASTPVFLIRGDDSIIPFTIISYAIPNIYGNFFLGNAFLTGVEAFDPASFDFYGSLVIMFAITIFSTSIAIWKW